jgi:D-cysteine desulfhydrase
MRAYLSADPLISDIPNVALLPLSLAAQRRRRRAYVMGPGGASPIGCLGHVGAALELAEQIQAGLCPAPRFIVLAVGSTCTTAGLLTGLALAAKLGVAFGPGRSPLPKVVAVRATPWPVTSPVRIIGLARRTAEMLARTAGDRCAIATGSLASYLEVDGSFLGRGYGRAAASTRGAMAVIRRSGGPELDEVYSGKAGAGLLLRLAQRDARGPFLFWATKSSAPLPAATPEQVSRAPRRWRRWLELAPKL